MDENVKFVAAYIYLMETIALLNGDATEIAETLLELAKWMKNEYRITDEDISSFKKLVGEIQHG